MYTFKLSGASDQPDGSFFLLGSFQILLNHVSFSLSIIVADFPPALNSGENITQKQHYNEKYPNSPTQNPRQQIRAHVSTIFLALTIQAEAVRLTDPWKQHML